MKHFRDLARRRSGTAWMLGASSGLALLAAAPAWAQTAPSGAPAAEAADDNGALTEIVVTAQRRSENLQKVPIAVSAIPADALASKGVRTTEDLNILVAGLNTQRVSGANVVFLRGVGTNSRAPGLEPPIAFYVDSVYYAGALSSASSFNNIERIEVLKGPQGTLFGRNSMGGLINVITKDPSFDGLTGHMKGGYGNYNTYEGDVYVSGPITSNLAADFSGYGTYQGDGWGKNLTIGGDANFRKEFGYRSKWQWKPDDDTVVTLTGDYSYIQTDIGASAMILPGLPTPPASLALATFRGSIYDTISNLRSIGKSKIYGGYFRVAHDFEPFRVVNTTSYRKVKRVEVLDNDATPYPLSDVYFTDRTEAWTNELQFLAPSGNRIQWQAGLYYFHMNAGYRPQKIIAPAFGASLFRINDSVQYNTSYSAYAQATFPLFTDNTQITLGGRYTTDHKKFTGTTSSALALLFTVPAGTKKTESKFTYRAAISQQLNPTMLAYASISTGFKSGYWNASNPSQPPVDPETLTDYEVGLKTELFDRRVRLNVAGFYYDYKNLQLTQTRPTGALTANAAQSTVYGVEIEGQANVTRQLSLTYGISFVHSNYDNYINATSFVTSPVTGIGVTTPINNTGHDLQRTPKATANIGFDYVIPSSVGEFGLNANYAYNDGFFFEPDNQLKQRAYSLVNTEIRWTPTSERLVVRAWMKNALDKKFYTLARTATGQPPYGSPGAPRTYGASVEVKF